MIFRRMFHGLRKTASKHCSERTRRRPHLKGLIAYAYRHSFATDALVNGVGIAQVAELLGHTSTEMVMRHYSHIAGKIDHMRDAAMKAANNGSVGQ